MKIVYVGILKFVMAFLGVMGIYTSGFLLGVVSERMKDINLAGCEAILYDPTGEVILSMIYAVCGGICLAASVVMKANLKEESKYEK